MSALYLLRLLPDARGFMLAAARRGFLPPGGDLGYALHAALTALFGSEAPRPFAWRETGSQVELLAYTSVPERLKTLASLPQGVEMADFAAALRPETLELRPLPETWPQALRLGFTVRVRPVVRARPRGRQGGHDEHDVYAHAKANGTLADGETREDVYRRWLSHELARGDAADLEAATLLARRSSRVLRRPGREGVRRSILIEGPDVTFRGILRVRDGAAFSALLARGLGRHRAFGFGMLLLAPPGRC